MVDRLKRSLEQLDPPACPNCQSEMNWFRSSLEDAITVVHIFVCPGCSNTAETRTMVRESGVPPGKLSAPHQRAA